MPSTKRLNTPECALRRGVFLDLETLHPADLQLSELRQTLPDWTLHARTRMDATAERIRNAEVVISNKVVLDETAIEHAPSLQLICVAATGVNNIDLAACRRRGITVCNAQGYGTDSVAQHTWALILALANQLASNHHIATNGNWASADQFCLLQHPITQLRGKILGIVGYGNLGQAVARIAEAFGMRVMIARRDQQDHRPGRVELTQLLQSADVLSLHCPLTEQTRHLIGKPELARMKPSALLINTARGGLVDETALAEALAQGIIAGAASDVLSSEPPTPDNPLLQPLPNLILTPHMAWSSQAARQAILDQTTENILAFSRGKQVRVVA